VPSFPLLAIGASTGGPAAVASLLQGVPRSYPAALVLIQHLNAEFAESLMQWLGQQLSLPVRLARQGQPPEAGVLLLAATQDHLCLGLDGLLHYITEPKDYPYRPSVDVFFHSVAQHWRGVAAGVLLTGMGRDGAQGLLAMRQRGFLTLAQNQASCVVYGMPKAAVEAGAVTRLGDLTQLNLNIQQLFTDTAPYLPPTNVDKPQ
jgi:two-component system response regulator WspF